jgi:cobalamin biosynthesis protein CobD/CbiB
MLLLVVGAELLCTPLDEAGRAHPVTTMLANIKLISGYMTKVTNKLGLFWGPQLAWLLCDIEFLIYVLVYISY